MPPSTLCSPLIRSIAQWHLHPRASTLLRKLPRLHCQCNSLAARPTVSIAKFSTAPAKHAESGFGVTSMPPDRRAESRRQERLDTDTRALERNYTRDWKAGDVYAPHDLSAAEARKWKKRQRPSTDAFDALSMNPLDCYKVSSIIKSLPILLIKRPELLDYGRIHDGNGTNQAFSGYRFASGQSAQDSEGYPTCNCCWIDAECSSASRADQKSYSG
jgi:hypothetical protein